MTYSVKICPKCKTSNEPNLPFCGKCGADLPATTSESDVKPFAAPAYARPKEVVQPVQFIHTEPTECRIVDIEMPFWSLVNLMVKLAVAAIPAFIILIILAVAALAVLSAIGVGMRGV